jgi:hypothetical protein
MATNLPRVFAAGDISDYPGKVRLIAVGFGEAATAVNNAAVIIDPAAHLFPGHSSDQNRGPGRAHVRRKTRQPGAEGAGLPRAKAGVPVA